MRTRSVPTHSGGRWRGNRHRWPAGLLTAGIVLLAGCATGTEQNYRELERGPQPLEPERDPMFGDESPRLAAEAMDEAVLAATIAAAANAAPEPATADTPAALTLAGTDRLDWEAVSFQPPTGQITHPPIYIRARPVSDDLTQVVHGPVDSRLEAAMAGGQRERVTLGRVAAVPIEAGWFYVQSALMPAKVLVRPPTTLELTPESPRDPPPTADSPQRAGHN